MSYLIEVPLQFIIAPSHDSVPAGSFGLGAKSTGLEVVPGGGTTGYVIWHAGNHGTGSGLDADKLDGQHGSYYQTAITNPVTGTGTQNYVTKWNNAGGTSIGNSLIFDNGTNVGIGTTNPWSKLSVVPAANGAMEIANTITTGQTVGLTFGSYIGTNGYKFGGIFFERKDNNERGTLHFATVSTARSTNVTLADSKMAIDMNGNVGIGTTAPATTLDVNGVINAATGYRIANAATSGNYLRGNGTNFVSSAIQVGDLPSHSHSYLPLSGGTMTGTISMNGTYVFPITAGSAGQVLRMPASGINLSWVSVAALDAGDYEGQMMSWDNTNLKWAKSTLTLLNYNRASGKMTFGAITIGATSYASYIDPDASGSRFYGISSLRAAFHRSINAGVIQLDHPDIFGLDGTSGYQLALGRHIDTVDLIMGDGVAANILNAYVRFPRYTTAGFLKVNTSGVMTVDTTSYGTVTPAALTKTDDTNVTLTLGGTPSTALLQATSITVGWAGTLADGRIASASTWNAKQTGHANLTSLAALSYVSASFVKMTAAGTFALDTNTYSLSSHTHGAATPAAHALIDTVGHTVSGLTIGHFLKATGATTYAFGVHGLTYSDVGAAASSHTHDDRYYTETEIGNFFSGTTAITGYNKSNWDTAHGWGNHASAGYLTSQTSHADVLQDGDFTSQGIMLRGATAGSYSILTNNAATWNALVSFPGFAGSGSAGTASRSDHTHSYGTGNVTGSGTYNPSYIPMWNTSTSNLSDSIIWQSSYGISIGIGAAGQTALTLSDYRTGLNSQGGQYGIYAGSVGFDITADHYAVYGWAVATHGNTNFGGYFLAQNSTKENTGVYGQGSHHGVYAYSPTGEAIHAETRSGWAIYANGNSHYNGYLQIYGITAPAITTNRLYVVGGDLKWNGSTLSTGSSMTYPGSGIALSTGSAWGTSIPNNSGNWDTAHGWGNHASAGYVTGTPWTTANTSGSSGSCTGNAATATTLQNGATLPNTVYLSGSSLFRITSTSIYLGTLESGADADYLELCYYSGLGVKIGSTTTAKPLYASALYDNGTRVSIQGHTHSYLSAEADTLATVTGRGATTSTALTLDGGLSGAVTGSSYGNLKLLSSTGGFGGIYLDACAGTVTGMYDTSGNGGDWDSSTSWHFYWHRGNACLGIGGSTTTAGYRARVNGTLYVDGATFINGTITMPTAGYVYPGYFSGQGTGTNVSYFLAGSTTWGLYSNTSLNVQGIYDVGNRCYSASSRPTTVAGYGITDAVTGTPWMAYVLPSGTTNQMLRHDGSSWVATSALTMSATTLTITKATSSGDLLILADTSTVANGYSEFQLVAGSRQAYIWLRNQNGTSEPDGSLSIYAMTGDVILWAGGTRRFTVKSTGNVGIGIPDPGYPLEIANTNSVSFAFQRTGYSCKKWGFTSDNSSFYIVNLTDGNYPLTISNSGYVGILNTGPSYYLEIGPQGYGVGTSGIRVNGDGFFLGDIICQTLTERSSFILKANIVPMESQLAKITQLNPVDYILKENSRAEKGFISEEVINVYPEFATATGVNYSRMVSVLTKGIQELYTIIEDQKTRIELLENSLLN